MLVDAERSKISFIITTIKWRAIIRCNGIWYPMCSKYFVKLGITLDLLVERMISTSGYLEYLSITMRRYSPDGNGP